MIRFDTTRGDLHISPYLAYQPADREVASAWRTLIAEPGEHALRDTYENMLRTNTLEQLFHYRPAGS
jgi:hypothetical protein